MLWILIIVTFITLILLPLAKNSFLGREFRIYKVLMKYPFLDRHFISQTFTSFE